MKKLELPQHINCPFCDKQSSLLDINPNDAPISAAQFFDDCTEFYDGDLAPYMCQSGHSLYVIYDPII